MPPDGINSLSLKEICGGDDDEMNQEEFLSDWDADAVQQAMTDNATSDLPLSLQDLWTKGNEKFIKEDVGARREVEAKRAKVHLELQKEVFKMAEKRQRETQTTVVGTESDSPPSLAIEATRAFMTKLKISNSNSNNVE